MLQLSDGLASVSIHPEQGGGIGKYLVKGVPILACHGPGREGAFALGCQILAPFANRISGGGFAYDGRFYPLQPNMAGEPFPIHGNAAGERWHVQSSGPEQAELRLESNGPGAFRYGARLHYMLHSGCLTAHIELTNLAEAVMPFGVGFHPWFVRTPQTTLAFAAGGHWTESTDHLPLRFVPAPGGHGSAVSQPLADGFMNTAFPGWSGSVDINWPETRSGARLTARGMNVLMVYSPGKDANFVCVEPVSHTVDAHNRRGQGVVAPAPLQKGESLLAEMIISPFFDD